MFYAELFDIATTESTELDITSLDDLDASGLVVADYDETGILRYLANDENVSVELKKNFMTTIFDTDYIIMNIVQYKNMSFFMEDLFADFLLPLWNRQYRQYAVKRADLCLHTAINAFKIPNRSPYKNQINEILLRIQESGIREKFYKELVSAVKHIQEGMYDRITIKADTPEVFVSRILLYVYIVPFIVFIGEVILNYFRSR